MKDRYKDVDDYISTFEPLLFEEVKAQISQKKDDDYGKAKAPIFFPLNLFPFIPVLGFWFITRLSPFPAMGVVGINGLVQMDKSNVMHQNHIIKCPYSFAFSLFLAGFLSFEVLYFWCPSYFSFSDVQGWKYWYLWKYQYFKMYGYFQGIHWKCWKFKNNNYPF